MGSASLAAARPTARQSARLPGPWRQYPSSPEGWGVKNGILWLFSVTDPPKIQDGRQI